MRTGPIPASLAFILHHKLSLPRMSSGSMASLSSLPSSRLTSIVSHLSDVRPKVVICRHLGPAMPLLLDRKDIDMVLWPEDRSCERAWLLENIKGAAGVLVLLGDRVNEELLDAAGPGLRVVSTMSVGYEHIDLPLMAQRNIRVGYTPDVLTEAVADISVMLALMAGRNDRGTYSLVKNGEWAKPSFGWSPVLGFGRIAQATLARLPHLHPDTERDAALQATHKLKALERVDVTASRARATSVCAHAWWEGDYHLVDAAFLRKMKPMSVLVNTSRGSVVDSDALATALREKWIWGAGLDVVEGEPAITEDHPLVKEPQCVMVPHIGSATFQTRLDMATRAIDNLIGGLFGGEMPAELGKGQ
ncbi:hypothetical protein B0H13DRAFT_1992519 [Mycena leptocephala]|nr:hypothetical protein B0H13DRAFT_1992519 [Mycena leptocephala]